MEQPSPNNQIGRRLLHRTRSGDYIPFEILTLQRQKRLTLASELRAEEIEVARSSHRESASRRRHRPLHRSWMGGEQGREENERKEGNANSDSKYFEKGEPKRESRTVTRKGKTRTARRKGIEVALSRERSAPTETNRSSGWVPMRGFDF
jgi:hypothetical protein